jgi:GNAT superfamily N-acetyltransferase
MLGRCSRATLFRRFHGYSDGTAHVRSLTAGRRHLSTTAWDGADCVGLATLAAGPGGHDLGVLVEDRFQRRGVGTALVARLLADARVAGVASFGADLLYDTAFAVRLLAQAGPLRSSLDWGVLRVTVDLASPGHPSPGRPSPGRLSPGPGQRVAGGQPLGRSAISTVTPPRTPEEGARF